jgi:hypothetical protein
MKFDSKPARMLKRQTTQKRSVAVAGLRLKNRKYRPHQLQVDRIDVPVQRGFRLMTLRPRLFQQLGSSGLS